MYSTQTWSVQGPPNNPWSRETHLQRMQELVYGMTISSMLHSGSEGDNATEGASWKVRSVACYGSARTLDVRLCS